jgi:hypothetical protein|tara:strand:+ start:5712 stop:6047 length:336 start_codon:yes stop_codon:yes gene_type:complete
LLSSFAFNALTSAAFEGNFGAFQVYMFNINSNLATVIYSEGTTGWPQNFDVGTLEKGYFRFGTFESPVHITTISTGCAAHPATPVPTSPLWLLGIMAGLLSLVCMRKLRIA